MYKQLFNFRIDFLFYMLLVVMTISGFSVFAGDPPSTIATDSSFKENSYSLANYPNLNNNELKPGDSVCIPMDGEGQNSQCLYVSEFVYTITKDNDSFEILKEKLGDKEESQVENIKIFDLILQKSKATFNPDQSPVDFYVKIHWKGVKGTLGAELHGEHYVKGHVFYSDDLKKYQLKMDSIPDLMLAGQFFILFDKVDIAELFGRNIDTDAKVLEQEVKAWILHVIKDPIENYLNSPAAEASPAKEDSTLP